MAPPHRPSTLLAAILTAAAGLGWACQQVTEARSDEPEETLLEPAEGAPEVRKGNLRAGFLIVDGVYNTELTAPYDVLEHTLYHTPNGQGIEVFTVSPDGGPILTAERLKISADHSFESAPPIDILVVPSAQGSRDRDLKNEEMISWVRETGEEAQFVLSLCWGAFVLAEADLLDGLSMTTFPSDYQSFQGRFPDLDLRVNVSFVHDGKAITSQGGSKSFDPAMYLVDLLYGEDVARRIGGGLLIPWPQASMDYVRGRSASGT